MTPAPLEILFEDESILAVNKPAGLLTIQDGYQSQLPHLYAQVVQYLGQAWIVHRLDKDTSGLVLFAKSALAHQKLSLAFEQRQVQKSYLAICLGQPPWETISVNRPLRINVGRRHRTIVDPAHGRPARTDLRVLERFDDCALVECSPHSGYTHQIRAHLFSIGHPILQDPLYFSPDSPSPPTPPIQRLALHAAQIHLTHPLNLQPLTLQAPTPADFVAALQTLRQSR